MHSYGRDWALPSLHYSPDDTVSVLVASMLSRFLLVFVSPLKLSLSLCVIVLLQSLREGRASRLPCHVTPRRRTKRLFHSLRLKYPVKTKSNYRKCFGRVMVDKKNTHIKIVIIFNLRFIVCPYPHHCFSQMAFRFIYYFFSNTTPDLENMRSR